MNYEVNITQEGRGGQNHYIENGKSLSFGWDFSSIGVEIYVPTRREWDAYCEKHDASWAKGRRQEILQRLAEEVRRQKYQSSRISIEENVINLWSWDARIITFLRKIFH